MTRRRHVLVIALVALASFGLGRSVPHEGPAVAASPQDADPQDGLERLQMILGQSQPGPHHRHLDPTIGSWVGTVRLWLAPGLPPMSSKATVEREWVLDGRFVRATFAADSLVGRFEGIAYIGYDNRDGEYTSVWLENQSTTMMHEVGQFDAASKTMHMRGHNRGPDGTMKQTRAEIDLSDPDRHVMRGYTLGPDGRETLSFEGVFERTP